MTRLVVTIHLALLAVAAYVLTQVRVLSRAREDRGSVTIEQVMWAAAIIGIVLLVVGVIRGFVGDEIDKIEGS